MSPADEASIAAWIVALADDSLVPELESEPVEPLTYQDVANTIIGININVIMSFFIGVFLSLGLYFIVFNDST